MQHALIKDILLTSPERERRREKEKERENILSNIFSTRNLQVRSDVIKMATYIQIPGMKLKHAPFWTTETEKNYILRVRRAGTI